MNRKLWVCLTMCVGWLLFATGGAGAPAQVAAASQSGQAAPPSGSGAPQAAEASPAAPQEPADTPYTLVASGVTSYTINDPKIFWYSGPACLPPPPPAPSSVLHETIQRIATYGGAARSLYSHPYNSGCPSNPDVISNIVSDGNYLYWISSVAGGLVKLSVNANVGDSPKVVNTDVKVPAQLARLGSTVFVLTQQGTCILLSINLNTGAGTLLAAPGAGATDFQSDDTYVYWIRGGVLHQWDIATAKEKSTIASGVTGYHPASATVYYGKGKFIYRFGNASRTADLIYTSSNATARVFSLKYDNAHLFWFEDHTLPLCGGCITPEHDDVLFRAGPGGGSAAQIYIFHASVFPQASELKGSGDYLFWLENGVLQKLPKDAAALPKINLVADGLEVTQGVQYFPNAVPLIQNRDTYVRFYVHSAGVAVAGVTAYLYRTDSGGAIIDGPLSGGLLAVLPSPHRYNLNDSFLFELPWNWVNGSALHLKAKLNPNQDPLEPNYADDASNQYNFTFLPSPRLAMNLVEWGYPLKGQIWWPTSTDENLTLSWVRRAYPLASDPGWINDPAPGFRPDIWYIEDDALGSRVDQTATYCLVGLGCFPACSDNKCASAYTNSTMDSWRGGLNIPDNLFFYGMITDRAGIFPRGQACCGTNVSSGPAGCCSYGWDTDGSYADWYAAHEIGHTLGRQHPASSGSPICDSQSADDGSYPYPRAHIGPTGGSLEGFDVGDGALGLPNRIYPGTTWTDVMSYCNNNWISDYTYIAMYNYMIANPSPPPAGPAAPQAPALAGNWLVVSGEIVTAAANVAQHVPGLSNTAFSALITRVRHVSTVAALPARVPGPYSIQLFDGSSTKLADYPFTPQPATSDAPTWLHFSQVVTYVANTAQVRIVQLAGNVTLATQPVSPHAPTVSNVALAGAPNPVTGTVSLGWDASDADGDPLTFDVYYSRDGGATLQPVAVNISAHSLPLDTTHLGGSGTAMLRVVANDGVNTGQADSAPFTMANKPPQPEILTPADGTHRHWGQLVNFSGDARDAQDGGVDPSHLAWRDQKGALGTGATLSISDLPVGTDVITLTATDSLNQKASTSITVYVDDDLSLPGPTVSVGPDQFDWAFTATVSAPQADVLTLDNVGGGVLTWTATTDAPWLKLSLAAGTAPSAITLTADPSSLANNAVYTGHVFVDVAANGSHPAQHIVVPVSASVAFDYSHPAAVIRLYLPVVER